MFETEAEEYSNNWRVNKNTNLNFAELVELRAVIYKANKDGAEFGYNKANEWHYIRNKDLPKNSNKVVGMDILENPFITWYENGEWKDENGKTLTTNIIAWKEIVLPKK